MTGIDRTQILRIDCNTCKGKGYETTSEGERACSSCEGRGTTEKEVPFKFETNGRWEKEEIAEAFELPVDQITDAGHSAGD
ncbi:MAG: hypothetical protein RBG13Loki_0361 [Promethearchaeota archaeon CR_4]|nr:MAG: hypothetical protein RBG13Loki_0361 [Candidatus Lokiarchaeota archaeon CR_4]